MQSRTATLLTLILLATLFLAACVPVSTLAPTPTTPATPTADVPSASAGFALHPPIAEVCNGMAQVMMQVLNTEVTQSEVAMTDPTTGTSGRACRAMTTGTGAQFTSPYATLQSLSAVLTGGGWQEDMSLAASGPTGDRTGFRSRDLVCLATVEWEPDASANCPTDEPISACQMTPEQQLYTVTIDCVQTAVLNTTYDDPFAYCRAVGTMDAPDERYTGPAVPDAVIQGLRTAMETPDATADLFAEGRAFWRCMDSQVYGCVVGANIPCMDKADTSQEPSPEMVEFCQQNPGAEVIPAVVTGRATIYDWRCDNNTPTPGDLVTAVDAQGYSQNFWYKLPAP